MALKSEESFHLQMFYSPYVTTAGNQLAFFAAVTKYSIVSEIVFDFM